MFKNPSIFNKLGIAITCVLLGYICYIGIKNVFRYNVFIRKLEINLVKYESLLKKNDFLKKQVLALQDSEHLLFEVRRKLGYISKDETVYKIVKW